MRGSDAARQQPGLGGYGGRDETAERTPAGESLRWEGIQEELASRISRLEVVLADAAAAAASMRELLDPLGSLSRFIKDLETSLEEVRGAFEHSQAPASVASIAPIGRGASQVVPAAAEEASVEEQEVSPEPQPSPEPEPSAASTDEAPTREEEKGPESEPPSEPRREPPVLLRFESSEGYIDLMTVDRVLRETPSIADLELAQYEGKNATIRVWLAGDGEVAQNVIHESVQEIEAGFQKHASGVRVELIEGQEED